MSSPFETGAGGVRRRRVALRRLPARGLVTRELAVDGPITVRNDLIFSFDVTVAFILLFNFK